MEIVTKEKLVQGVFIAIIELILVAIMAINIVHLASENKRLRSRAESLCTLFSKTDESICRQGINNILDMSEEEFKNYAQLKGLDK